MRSVRASPVVLAAFIFGGPGLAEAGEGAFGWMSGDWYLTVGATGLVAPDFEGSKSYILTAQPIILLGKAGPAARFTSRNDNISLG
ncbi:MltA-interacting MipA family protein (fragment) [Mesorhizobium prunaredense]|uniref:MltA-interacting MipA family protein n=1 Tax=Mesorhizobium prunaredense TaxID=1631249 RepID=A0A1R3UZK8_9HYPH